MKEIFLMNHRRNFLKTSGLAIIGGLASSCANNQTAPMTSVSPTPAAQTGMKHFFVALQFS